LTRRETCTHGTPEERKIREASIPSALTTVVMIPATPWLSIIFTEEMKASGSSAVWYIMISQPRARAASEDETASSE